MSNQRARLVPGRGNMSHTAAGERATASVQQTPHFALQIMKVIAERLRKMDERL